MSKFIIKESSIKSGINQRSLQMIQDELSKYVDDLKFEISFPSGNYCIWESLEFTPDKHKLMSPEKLKVFIAETLNFRYENFTVTFIQ